MVTAVELSEGLATTATIVGLAVGVAGAFAFLWAASKVQGTEKSIELLSTSLDAVNLTLERERHERELERAVDKRRAEDSDAKCASRIADLEGRVALLTSGFVASVGASIADAVRHELAKPPKPTT